MNKIRNRIRSLLTIRFETMIAIILISVTIISLVSFFYLFNLRNFYQEKMTSFSKQIVTQTGDRIDTEIAQLNKTLDQLISYTITTTSPNIGSKYNEILMLKQSETMIQNINYTNLSLSGIFMLAQDRTMYSATEGTNADLLFEMPWIEELFKIKTGRIVVPTHNADYMYISRPDYYLPVVSFVQKIERPEKDNGIQIIQLDLKYNYLVDIFCNIQGDDNDNFIIVDGNNKLIYHPDKTVLGKDVFEADASIGNNIEKLKTEDSIIQDDLILVSYDLNSVDWSLIGIVSTKSIKSQYIYIRNVSLVIMAIAIIFSILVSFYLTRRITKPLTALSIKMEDVAKGNFEYFNYYTQNVDMKAIIESFDTMVRKIKTLMSDVVKKETEKTTTELQALKSQINSHFLYNSLEVIRSIAIENQVGSIAEMSQALSKLFRYSINNTSELVSIYQEFDIIKGYIRIHEFRYVDRFDVDYIIDENILQCKIIRFIIQPLIENAIHHGIESVMRKGMIVISAYRRDNRIVIKVKDNGVGIDEQKVDYINHALQDNNYDKSIITLGMGIGIINVNTRIKMHYGKQYGLNIKSKANKGTEVEIIVPVIY